MKVSIPVIMVVWLACSPGLVRACTTPVYQYALDNWEPDDFQVVVFHESPLQAAAREAVGQLRQATESTRAPLNAVVREVDLAGDVDSSMQELWQGQPDAALPWMTVRRVDGPASPVTVWSGPLNAETVRAVVDSPARQAIVRDLVTGTSVAWVFLATGNAEEDEAAQQRLRETLDEISRQWKQQAASDAPETAPADGVSHEVTPPEVGFSIVRVLRSDPAERLLVHTLLASESDLRDYDEPMAFPVFGRGRVLYALVGRGINPGTISDACAELLSACSCFVKSASPGTDLLMRAAWQAPKDDAYFVAGDDGPTTRPGRLAESRQPQGITPPEAGSDALVRNSILGMAGGVFVVAAIMWLATSRRSEK